MSNFLYAEQLVSSFLLNEVTTSKEGCIQSIKRLVESNLENSSIVVGWQKYVLFFIHISGNSFWIPFFWRCGKTLFRKCALQP
jgi:hypothetical protein